MAEQELRDAVAQLCAAMASQQTEMIALRQQHAAEQQLAAEERRNLISLLASRTGSGADDVVDGKGVGQPSS